MDDDARLTRLELKLEQGLATEARIAALEKQQGQLTRKSDLRDWLQTLGPYLSGLIVLIIGFALKDSVNQALQREQLNLEYVKQMRDLIQDFDAATEQPAADANAIGLAMYGRHAIAPLIERLQGGDVAKLAAERGLHLATANDPEGACPRLTQALRDPSRRQTWQSIKTLTRVIGAGDCVPSLTVLERQRDAVTAIGQDPIRLASFATRFTNPSAVDFEATDSLVQTLQTAIDLLEA